jgi:hypothetical protein
MRFVLAPALEPAPADLPPGRRGWRARASGAVALAGVAALVLPKFHGHSAGGTAYGDWTFSFDTGPQWSRPVLYDAAACLIGAGVVLWKARRRGLAWLAAVLSAAALAAAVVNIFGTGQGAGVSPPGFQNARIGVPQRLLQGRLGEPMSTGTADDPAVGREIPCLAYRAVPTQFAGGSDPMRSGSGMETYLFCFDKQRLLFKEAV